MIMSFVTLILTLRAIALKRSVERPDQSRNLRVEIITLRAIALKQRSASAQPRTASSRDHNATSYSTETLKMINKTRNGISRDHNATSYSTETLSNESGDAVFASRDHNVCSVK